MSIFLRRTIKKIHSLMEDVTRITLISLLLLHGVIGQQQLKSTDVSTQDNEFVCNRTIDVRNVVESFKQLENCTVIEGNLQITLITINEKDNITFPKLREITDYLLIYRIDGLKSIERLFPNLTVIRGRNLFFNYGLVMFEMPDLEDIGLYSLTSIVRGGIRIEKNPRLCYISTLEWDDIVMVQKEERFIIQNKLVNECVNLCPTNITGQNICPIKKNTHLETGGGNSQQPMCWNVNHCQKVCPDSCPHGACYTSQHCCHAECIGGCTGPFDTDCVACRGMRHNGTCVKVCPKGWYSYLDRRCLLESQCKSITMNLREHERQYYKILDNGRCELKCPPDYKESIDKHRCERCDGPCPIVCPAILIDNVASAERLKGCTVIKGSLAIQIRGGDNVGALLEEYLGKIEEVTDCIKIIRSYTLVSLSFLRNLRIIHGAKLHHDKFAFYLFDNQNLKDIWNVEAKNHSLAITRGQIAFHLNRRLCANKIDAFVKIINFGNATSSKNNDKENVVTSNNGDLIACDVNEINVTIESVNSHWAMIKWENIHIMDPRELLSWTVYYKQTNDENVSIFNERNACGIEEWLTNDVNPETESGNGSSTTSFLYPLEPYTKYAVYVQTYTISSSKSGAISTVSYFTTHPASPSPVRDIFVIAKYPGELLISWKAPSSPNGNVTHYFVFWQPRGLNSELHDMKNYCNDKLKLARPPKEIEMDQAIKNSTIGCCACPKSKDEIRYEDNERKYQIQFENFLQDQVFRKNNDAAFPKIEESVRKKRSISHDSTNLRYMPLTDSRDTVNQQVVKSVRWKRGVNTSDIIEFAKNSPLYHKLLANVTDSGQLDNTSTVPLGLGQEESYEAAVVYGKMEINISNLKHFQEYSIEVVACHEYNVMVGGYSGAKLCSNRAISSARTLPDPLADNIDSSSISIMNRTKEVSHQKWITWKDPPFPNGLIVVYEIELARVDYQNFKPDTICIPHKKFREEGGYLVQNINHGNWSFKIRATSLAGIGEWTNQYYFVIEGPVSSSTLPIVLSIIGFVIVVFVVGITIYVYGRKRMEALMKEQRLYVLSANPHYHMPSDQVYVPDEWEVPREKVKVGVELGQGSFGMVYEGILCDFDENDPKLKVAIKTVNEQKSIMERINFLNEASVMKSFNCPHVVKLLGVVSKGQPTLVIMELMDLGDLKNYLRRHRPDEPDNCGNVPPTLSQSLEMAGEIADGMAYLSAKKFVHRDLAARNCMVSKDMIVKIGDFGMARDIYDTDYYRKDTRGMLPIRWMAPESLKDGIFTSHSDVWSFGVVLWEMATLAAQPYQGLSNEQVVKFIIESGIMEMPEGCPSKLYDMMLQCWKHNPKHRPTFEDILDRLAPDLTADFHSRAYYMNPREEAAEAAGVAEGTTGDDADDMELVHSKTPLHPNSSSAQHHAEDKRKSIESLSSSVNNERYIDHASIADHFSRNALPGRQKVSHVSTQNFELEDKDDYNTVLPSIQSVKVLPVDTRAIIKNSDAIPLQSSSKANGCISGSNNIGSTCKETPYTSSSVSGRNGLVKACHSLETSLTRT